VNSVKVEGAEALKEGQIKKVLKTRTRSSFAFWAAKPLYRQDFLRTDIEIIRQFAAQHGFHEAVRWRDSGRWIPDGGGPAPTASDLEDPR